MIELTASSRASPSRCAASGSTANGARGTAVTVAVAVPAGRPITKRWTSGGCSLRQRGDLGSAVTALGGCRRRRYGRRGDGHLDTHTVSQVVHYSPTSPTHARRRHTAVPQNRHATAWNPTGGCGVQLSSALTSPDPPGLFDSTIRSVPSVFRPVTSTVCTPAAHAPSAPSA